MVLKLDYSRLSLFHQCERAYYYQYIRGIIPKTIPTALSVGSFIHKYISKPTVEEKAEFLQTYSIIATKNCYNFENICKVIEKVEQYLAENFLEDSKKEVKLESKILGRISYSGILDMVDTKNNIIYEFKTTSIYNEPYTESFSYSFQNIGYEWLARKNKLVDVNKLILHKIAFIDLKNCKIVDKLMTYSELQLNMFYSYLKSMIKTLKAKRNIQNYIPNLHACKGTYPTWNKCQYLPLCYSSKEQFNSIRKLLYNIKEKEEK